MSDFIIQDSLVVVGLCLKATVQLCSTWLEGYKQKKSAFNNVTHASSQSRSAYIGESEALRNTTVYKYEHSYVHLCIFKTS